MQNNLARSIQQHSLWLSVLFHLLFFLNFAFVYPFKSAEEKKPGLEIPAYVYENPQRSDKQASPEKPTPKVIKEEKPIESANEVNQSNKSKEYSNEYNVVSISNNTEPVHLVGDKNVDKPLLTLLGKALTRKLVYPKIALDFQVRGIAAVGFLLFPDGEITNVQLVQSSGKGVLDEAAVAGVMAISPVPNVKEYIQAPKFLVVGIIFG